MEISNNIQEAYRSMNSENKKIDDVYLQNYLNTAQFLTLVQGKIHVE